MQGDRPPSALGFGRQAVLRYDAGVLDLSGADFVVNGHFHPSPGFPKYFIFERLLNFYSLGDITASNLTGNGDAFRDLICFLLFFTIL